MRKVTLIFLMILFLTLAGTCFAVEKLYDSRDEVTLMEMSTWGNKDSIQDLTMQMHLMYQYRLHWMTTVPMSNHEETVTEYTSSITEVYPDTDTYSGLNLDSSPGGLNSFMINEAFMINEDREQNITGVMQAYQELADITEANEKNQKEIYLNDYIDYYDYNIELDLPGTQINSRVNTIQKESVQEQKDYMIKKINDFFKIPVLETENWSISLEKDVNGNISYRNSSNGDGDFFYMWIYNALAEKECYFTFNSHSEEGKTMDTSLIPGGYGIYCMPYDASSESCETDMFDVNADRISADVDGLKMVYSLDPQIDVMYLHLNEQKDKLILHAEEYDKYVVTIIDIASMATLQKIEVMDWDKDYGYQIYEKNNFVVTMVHNPQEEGKIDAVVLKKNEEGVFEISFISEIQNKNIPSFNTSNMYLAFDGTRLAMAGFLEEEEQGFRETCNVFVAVCDAEGLQYYGEYRNSLETGYEPERYYYHCQGDGLEPIVLWWGE